MTLPSFLLWTHLVVLVFLVGYALFWTIVAVPRPGREPAQERAFLAAVRALRVPPFGPLRLPLPALGWLGLVAAAVTGIASGGSEGTAPSSSMTGFVVLAVCFHLGLSLRPSLVLAAGTLSAMLATAVASVAWPPTTRGVLLAAHLVAVLAWLGHMFFWSFVVGPTCKRHPDRAFGEELRAASHRWGALGGPALLVLFLTGSAILALRGEVPAVFPWKLALVGAMVVYQVLVGHRRAPRLVWANMGVALVVLFLSVLLVHGGR